MTLQLEKMHTSIPADHNISSQTDDFIDNLPWDSLTSLYLLKRSHVNTI